LRLLLKLGWTVLRLHHDRRPCLESAKVYLCTSPRRKR
jgi:hypothetical protein